MNKFILAVISAIVFGNLFSLQAQNGFVIWSKGGGCDRELHYTPITDGTNLGPEKVAIKKGIAADIWPVISYDGEWIAFCRSPEVFEQKYGGCDYHNFGIWDLYIARIDYGKNLPAKPIKIGKGYFPSWSDDAKTPGKPKTLYFTKYTDQTIQKTVISPDGSFTQPVVHATCPVKKEGTAAHTQGSPDGKFILYRPRLIKVYSIEAKKDICESLGGCHPCWGPRSKYFIRSKNGAFFNTGTSVDTLSYDQAGVGAYFQGISNDAYWDEGRLWIIGRIGGEDQNAAGTVTFTEVDISNNGWKLGKKTVVGQGSACDIHMFPKNFNPDKPTQTIPAKMNISDNSISFTTQLKTTASGLALVVYSMDTSAKIAELFDMQGKRVGFIKMAPSLKNTMLINSITNGSYILKISGDNLAAQKTILFSR